MGPLRGPISARGINALLPPYPDGPAGRIYMYISLPPESYADKRFLYQHLVTSHYSLLQVAIYRVSFQYLLHRNYTVDKVDFHFFWAITARHELWASFGYKTSEDHQNCGIYTKTNVGNHVIFLNFWKIPNFINFATSYLVNHSSHQLIFIHFGNEEASPTNHLEVMNPQKIILPPYFGALKSLN